MNIFIITIIGIGAFLVIFFAMFPPPNDGSLIPQIIIKPEHYDIEITGLQDTYLVGEPYSFSYILYGFGDSCGSICITFPINKTDSYGTGFIPSCLKTIQTDFVLDIKKTYGTTYGHIALQESGNYTVKVTFEKGANGPTVVTKSFLVVNAAPTNSDNTSDEQLQGILYHCKQKELLVDGSIITEDGKTMKLPDILLEYFNSTHYIDNNTCKWQDRK
ncbi:MAG: hypothetical protein AABZ32_01695 [Bacteroidota bacterium]